MSEVPGSIRARSCSDAHYVISGAVAVWWSRMVSPNCSARAHLKARLTVRLTGVPECPLGVPEYLSDDLSYNPSDNGTPERGEPASAYGLGASVA